MEKDKIALLLEKYWNAETTIEEERWVKQYLEQEGIEDKWSEDESWFNALHNFKDIEAPEFNLKKPEEKIKIFKLSVLLKIAATLILISGVTFLSINQYHKIQEEKNHALQKQAEASLFLISETLNQGYQNLDESTEMIIKSSNQQL